MIQNELDTAAEQVFLIISELITPGVVSLTAQGIGDATYVELKDSSTGLKAVLKRVRGAGVGDIDPGAKLLPCEFSLPRPEETRS